MMNALKIIEPYWPEEFKAKAICFALDDNYVKYLAVTLVSLLVHAKHEEYYDIVVFSQGITLENQELLQQMLPENFSIRFYEAEQLSKDILGSTQDGKPWEVIYYRLLIPQLMKHYERVLFLDCDLAIHANLEVFFTEDFGKAKVVGVADYITYLDSSAHEQKHIQSLNLRNSAQYFNAGVVMFCTRKIDSAVFIETVKALLKRDLRYKDQDILNIVFDGQKQLLHPKFNLQTGFFYRDICFMDTASPKIVQQLQESLEHPVIIHYTAERKPWKDMSCACQDIYFSYADKTPIYVDYEVSKRGVDFSRVRAQSIETNTKNWINEQLSKYEKRKLAHQIMGAFSRKHAKKAEDYRIRINKLRMMLK